MGYYTNFTLSSDDSDEHEDGVALLSGYGNPFEEACKWYEHEEDMSKYSKLHPLVVFRLDGEGEETGDIWVKWFKNGEMQEWRLSVDRPRNPPKSW